MEAVDFPFDGLRPVWVSRAPKLVLAFARVLPEGRLADAKGWGDPSNGLLGSRALITVLNRDWNENISSGSYDDVRRKCVKFLVEAGIVLKDPDNPNKAPNDSTTGYALSPAFANLLKAYGTEAWDAQLQNFTSANGSLREKLRQEREMKMVPVTLPDGTLLTLSPASTIASKRTLLSTSCPATPRPGRSFTSRTHWPGSSTKMML